MSAAIRRVERCIKTGGNFIVLREDLVALLALAKSAAELKRRITVARRKLNAWCADKDGGGLVEAAMLLDGRYSSPKPLRRSRGKR